MAAPCATLFAMRPSRMIVVVSAVLALVLTGSPASAELPSSSSGADVAVDLGATAWFLLPVVDYTLRVANHGPQPLTSATVVVQFDPRLHAVQSTPCSLDAATDRLTCAFGPLAAGASVTVAFWARYDLPRERLSLVTTATRTASTPADLVPTNDTDSIRCDWRPDLGMAPPPYHLHC